MTKGSRPEPSSDLWDLVLDMDWPRVVQHVKNEPQDADFLEGHWHETPLYLACQHDPPVEAVRAVINAHPEAVHIASRENHDLPIHIACRYQADTPILEALLKDHPTTATKTTKWGLTPIVILWDFRRGERNHGTIEPFDDDDEFWSKVLVVLRAAARSYSANEDYFDGVCCNKIKGADSKKLTIFNSPNMPDFPAACQDERIFFVHGAVSLGSQGCPIEVLSNVIRKYPNQVFQRDQNGQLPLHVAIRRVSWSKHKRRRFEPKEKPILTRLLKAYPGSARERLYSDHDRYPLHSAVANGHTWSHGVQDIFLAAPEVLLVRDPVTGLFPFQLAGVPITEEKASGIDSLETVYRLLMAQPDVIYYLQQDTKRKEKSIFTHSTKDSSRKRTSKRMIFVAFAEHLFGTMPIGVCNKSVVDFFGIAVWDSSFLHLDNLFRLRTLFYKCVRKKKI